MVALEKGLEVSALILSTFLFFLLPKKGDIHLMCEMTRFWWDHMFMGHPRVILWLTYHCFSLLLAEMLSSPWACSFWIGPVISLFLIKEVSLLMEFFKENPKPPYLISGSALPNSWSMWREYIKGMLEAQLCQRVNRSQLRPSWPHHLHHRLGVKRHNLKPGVSPWNKRSPNWAPGPH